MIVLPPLVQAAAPVLAQAVDGLARLQQEALVNLLVGNRLRLLLQQQRPVRTVEGIDSRSKRTFPGAIVTEAVGAVSTSLYRGAFTTWTISGA